MLDIVLLRIMKHKPDYMRLIESVPFHSLHDQTKALIADFGKYFKKFPTHKVIDMQVFLPCFKRWHTGMSEEQFNTYVGVLRGAAQDTDKATKEGILTDLYELDMAVKIRNLTEQFDSGNLNGSLVDQISNYVDHFKVNSGIKTSNFIDTPIGEILDEVDDDKGIEWRLDVFNQYMRRLRGGDFLIVGARVDAGKTTMLTSETTYFAPQLPQDRNIIWLNNEGPGKRIKPRLYQAALGVPFSKLKDLNAEGKLEKMYAKVMGGRTDKIRIIDIHGMNVGQVGNIIDASNPGVIVYDMLDNIKGFRDEARTDLQLEEMYKWARDTSVKYDCIGIATSQISVEGEGLQFPRLSMLKDSKTGKQGACDAQIMIGCAVDPNLVTSRYIGIPKNKLKREGKPSDPRAEVRINTDISRYEDIT